MSDSYENTFKQLRETRFRPDLVISDYRLDKENTGIELIQNVQKYLHTLVPGIIITGDMNEEIINLAAGRKMDVLHKPVAPAKLYSLMSCLIKRE